jgi:hypothetical protein
MTSSWCQVERHLGEVYAKLTSDALEGTLQSEQRVEGKRDGAGKGQERNRVGAQCRGVELKCAEAREPEGLAQHNSAQRLAGAGALLKQRIALIKDRQYKEARE